MPEISMERTSHPIVHSGFPARLFFPSGLPPFDSAHEFALLAEDQAPPFYRMECVNLDLAYVLIDPFLIGAGYEPEFFESDFTDIGLPLSETPLVFSIVNLSHGIDLATVNLVGPLIVHPLSGKTKQVVLQNATKYSSRHLLLGS